MQRLTDLAPAMTCGVPSCYAQVIRVHSAAQVQTVVRAGKAADVLIGSELTNVIAKERPRRNVILVSIGGVGAGSQPWLGAGVPLARAIPILQQQGAVGWGNLVGIPGSIGGALWQNAGAYGVSIGELISAVEVVNLSSGEVEIWRTEDCGFGYRTSRFRRQSEESQGKPEWLIARAQCRASGIGEHRASYASLHSELKAACEWKSLEHQVQISRAVWRLRGGRLPHPSLYNNVGSVFLNPSVNNAQLQRIKTTLPDIPAWSNGDGSWRIPLAPLMKHARALPTKLAVHGDTLLTWVNEDQQDFDGWNADLQTVRRAIQLHFNLEIKVEPSLWN